MTYRRYVTCSEPGQFAALLKHRMIDHKRWQRDVLEEMVDEVLGALKEAIEKHEFVKGADQKVLLFPEPSSSVRQSVRTRQ